MTVYRTEGWGFRGQNEVGMQITDAGRAAARRGSRYSKGRKGFLPGESARAQKRRLRAASQERPPLIRICALCDVEREVIRFVSGSRWICRVCVEEGAAVASS